MKLGMLKSKWLRIPHLALAFLLVIAPVLSPVGAQDQSATSQQSSPHYTLVDMGTLPGGTFSQATWINEFGLVSGLSTTADGVQHATLWYNGHLTDITPNLGATLNSGAFSLNNLGQALLAVEIDKTDTSGENFCDYFTSFVCTAAVWQLGLRSQLPTLGGSNNEVAQINDWGQATGASETSKFDPDCSTMPTANGIGPLSHYFEPVIWGPKPGQIRALRLPAGDTVGIAMAINDLGEATGTTGGCANTELPPFVGGQHTIVWDVDGNPHDIGNLGGTANPALLGVGNSGVVINNLGWVTGGSTLAGNQTIHPFLWTKQKGMRDLGLLPGDFQGSGLNMNNLGEIVGASISSPGPAGGNPRAFVWRNGTMYDLNDLVQADAPLYLLTACGINDSGVITGFGVTPTGDIHGFVAIPRAPSFDESGPVTHPHVILSDAARDLLKRFGVTPFGGRGFGRH